MKRISILVLFFINFLFATLILSHSNGHNHQQTIYDLPSNYYSTDKYFSCQDTPISSYNDIVLIDWVLIDESQCTSYDLNSVPNINRISPRERFGEFQIIKRTNCQNVSPLRPEERNDLIDQVNELAVNNPCEFDYFNNDELEHHIKKLWFFQELEQLGYDETMINHLWIKNRHWRWTDVVLQRNRLVNMKQKQKQKKNF